MGDFGKWGKGSFEKWKENDSEHMHGVAKCVGGIRKEVNLVNLLNEIRKSILRKHILLYKIFYFGKGHSEIKTEMGLRN